MHITIRHVEPDDYRPLQALYAMPGVIAGTLQLPMPSELLWKNRLTSQGANEKVLVAVVEGRVVGHLGLHLHANLRRRHSAYIGMAVHDEWQGKGIGSQLMEACLDLADNWLNLLRIELTVFADNVPALRLYEKYGFIREGLQKAYGYQNGVYKDALLMARLKTG